MPDIIEKAESLKNGNVIIDEDLAKDSEEVNESKIDDKSQEV